MMYDMPPYVKTYIHRAGRTARTGKSGSCFTFLRKHEVETFDKMLKRADDSSCGLHSLPEESIENLGPVFSSALKKLEQSLKPDVLKKSKSGEKVPALLSRMPASFPNGVMVLTPTWQGGRSRATSL
ncbi:unnamed protein product [Alopecurus aequalis]